jgi:hypothetical protein
VTIKDARIVLRAQRVLEDHGLDDLPVSDAVRHFRQAQIDETGARQYLYDILGDCGSLSVGLFTLWYDDRAISVRDGRQPLVDFLVNRIESGQELPSRIEFERNGQPTIRLL